MSDRFEYAFYLFLWGIVSLIWYRGILFHTLDILDLNHGQSMCLLIILLVVFCVISAVLTRKYDRTGWSIIRTLALPYGIYSILAYINYRPKLIYGACLVAAVVTVITLVLIFFRRFPIGKSREQVLRNRIYNGVFVMSRNFALAFLGFMLVIGAGYVYKGSLLSVDLPVEDAYGTQYNLENNIEDICKLQPEVWQKLDIQERLRVLGIVMNCEANCLGIPHTLELGIVDLGEYDLGCYDDRKKQILLDSQHVSESSPEEVLNSLCHEVFHCAQHRLVDLYRELEPQQRNLYVFREAKVYLENIVNYEDGDENYESYYSQKLERDAREYAEDSVDVYYWAIQYYLKNGEL